MLPPQRKTWAVMVVCVVITIVCLTIIAPSMTGTLDTGATVSPLPVVVNPELLPIDDVQVALGNAFNAFSWTASRGVVLKLNYAHNTRSVTGASIADEAAEDDVHTHIPTTYGVTLNSSVSFYEHLAARVSTPFSPGLLAGTPQFRSILDSSVNKPKPNVYGYAYREYILQKYTLPASGLQPSDAFMAALTKASQHTSPAQAARALVPIWGTHYVNSVTFGGKLQRTYVIAQSSPDHNTHDAAGLLAYALNEVLGVAQDDHSHDWSDFSFESIFNIGSIVATGGTYLPQQDWSRYVSSVSRNPQAIAHTIAPIADLIQDNALASLYIEAIDSYYNACPFGLGDNPCSYRGTCNADTNSCSCGTKFNGTACEYITCPNGCSGHGLCITSTGKCHCNYGWGQLDSCAQCATEIAFKTPRYASAAMQKQLPIDYCVPEGQQGSRADPCGLAAGDAYCRYRATAEGHVNVREAVAIGQQVVLTDGVTLHEDGTVACTATERQPCFSIDIVTCRIDCG